MIGNASSNLISSVLTNFPQLSSAVFLAICTLLWFHAHTNPDWHSRQPKRANIFNISIGYINNHGWHGKVLTGQYEIILTTEDSPSPRGLCLASATSSVLSSISLSPVSRKKLHSRSPKKRWEGSWFSPLSARSGAPLAPPARLSARQTGLSWNQIPGGGCLV